MRRFFAQALTESAATASTDTRCQSSKRPEQPSSSPTISYTTSRDLTPETTKPACEAGSRDGRYWIRTSDLTHVKRAL
jgi:hypothetical protein